MTHDEAVARCQELNQEANDDRRWFPKQVGADEWKVVALSGTGFRPQGPLKGAVESRPRPSEPPDPRPSIFRNVPPYGAG